MDIDPQPAGQDGILTSFLVVEEGRLREAPKVRQLLRPIEPVRPAETCAKVLGRFLADAAIYALPIVDGEERPVALVDRHQYVEFFSKPFGNEIFGRRRIVELLSYAEYPSHQPVIVDAGASIDDVARIVIDAGMQHMVTGFIVSSEGCYLGMANGHALLDVITRRKQAELYFLAHYDGLTGLANRLLLYDRLERACRDAKRTGRMVALLFIDVDRFKQINDSLGHSVGDAVLVSLADRLKEVARGADTVARLGGDEFVILMEDIDGADAVASVAQRLGEVLRKPIEVGERRLTVTASIGSAIFPRDDTEISPLLAKADAAMYAAKTSGRDTFRSFEPGTPMYNLSSMALENELRTAIDRGELRLHYQPQASLATGEVVGVEALVRWAHPQRGLLSPGRFVPVAEDCGLIVPLGRWVLREAFRQHRSWHDRGVPPLRMSVNVSALQFRQPDFTGELDTLVREFRIDPRLFELEITESLLMQGEGDIKGMLDDIKALGMNLAIDDFGTGYSSLGYLWRFPIDRLKIDQSFVRGIERAPVNESIVRTIVTLAGSLGLDVVAEGIETGAERDILDQLRCRTGQGYWFSPPLPADDLVAWLREPGADRRSRDLFDVAVPTAQASAAVELR